MAFQYISSIARQVGCLFDFDAGLCYNESIELELDFRQQFNF